MTSIRPTLPYQQGLILPMLLPSRPSMSAVRLRLGFRALGLGRTTSSTAAAALQAIAVRRTIFKTRASTAETGASMALENAILKFRQQIPPPLLALLPMVTLADLLST